MDREPTRSDRSAPSDRRARLVLAILLAAIAFAGAGPAYVPSHDGPQHVFAVHVANHLDDPERGWGDWLEIAQPVTNLGFATLFSPLDLALPWPIALRIAVAAIALLWALGAYALARALHPQRAWLGIALAGAAYSWTFYMGFFSFHIAASTGLAVLAWAFARPRESPRDVALLAAMLLAVALLHVASAFAVGIALAALLWFRAPLGARAAACLRIALLAAPAGAVALVLIAPGLDSLGEPTAPGSAALSASTPWWTLGKCFAGGPAWRAWPLSLLALAAPAVALARRGRGLRAEDRALLAAGGAALAAAALLPLHIPSWEFFSPRFLPIAVSALVLSLPIERLTPRRRAAAAALLSGFAFASTAWAWTYHRSFASADALAGLDAPIVRRGVRLPIVLDPGAGPILPPDRAAIPFALPWTNLGQLYAASQGGLTPYGFTVNPRMHHLVVRADAVAHAPGMVDRSYLSDLATPGLGDDPGFRIALLTHVASRATAFEDVIFYGRPEEADHLRSLGFVEDWRRGGLSIARFRGCPVTVHVSPALIDAGVQRFEVGWAPARDASASYDVARGDPGADGSRALRLRQTCGSLWLRLLDARAPCDGADAEGRLVVASAVATPDVVCREAGESWPDPRAVTTPRARRGDSASAGASRASPPASSGSAARGAARSAP